MGEPMGLEVLLTPRKKVVADIARENVDVLLRLRALEVGHQGDKRVPLAISIVIDRSGSMSGGKLEEAKSAAIDLVKRLEPDDLVSIVVYDDHIKTILELMPVSFARSFVEQKVAQVRPGGSTNLHGGWLKGAEILAPKTNDQFLCRVILLSDGQANIGVTNVHRICEQVSELANAGITTTTVGFGLGFNEELMSAMAKAGQGNAWFGERIEDLQESFDTELSFLSKLAFKEVEVRVIYPEHSINMRNDYINVGINTWRFTGIPVGAEKWLAFSIPMRVAIDVQDQRGFMMEVEIMLRDTQGMEHTVRTKLPMLEIVSPETYRNAPEDELVARRFQEVEVADIQREVRVLIRDREYARAEQIIQDLIERTQNNPWLLNVVQSLQNLLSERDIRRMEKESLYFQVNAYKRSTELEELRMYDAHEESLKPAFLRKKMLQGRKSDSQK